MRAPREILVLPFPLANASSSSAGHLAIQHYSNANMFHFLSGLYQKGYGRCDTVALCSAPHARLARQVLLLPEIAAQHDDLTHFATAPGHVPASRVDCVAVTRTGWTVSPPVPVRDTSHGLSISPDALSAGGPLQDTVADGVAAHTAATLPNAFPLTPSTDSVGLYRTAHTGRPPVTVHSAHVTSITATPPQPIAVAPPAPPPAIVVHSVGAVPVRASPQDEHPVQRASPSRRDVRPRIVFASLAGKSPEALAGSDRIYPGVFASGSQQSAFEREVRCAAHWDPAVIADALVDHLASLPLAFRPAHNVSEDVSASSHVYYGGPRVAGAWRDLQTTVHQKLESIPQGQGSAAVAARRSAAGLAFIQMYALEVKRRASDARPQLIDILNHEGLTPFTLGGREGKRAIVEALWRSMSKQAWAWGGVTAHTFALDQVDDIGQIADAHRDIVEVGTLLRQE